MRHSHNEAALMYKIVRILSLGLKDLASIGNSWGSICPQCEAWGSNNLWGTSPLLLNLWSDLNLYESLNVVGDLNQECYLNQYGSLNPIIMIILTYWAAQ